MNLYIRTKFNIFTSNDFNYLIILFHFSPSFTYYFEHLKKVEWNS